MKYLPAVGAVAIIAIIILGVLHFRAASSAAPEDSPTTTHQSQAIKVEVVRYGPVQKKLVLTGQMNPTEHGRADVTTPLQGVVIQPLVKVGQPVHHGQELAEINNVYGQTTMQLQQKLEADQAAALGAQSAMQQAVSTLGQARSTLAQSETTLSQSIDNLNQSRAELANSKKDYHRKQRLFKAGVSSEADVEDAKERFEKANSAFKDTNEVVNISRRGVAIARKNIPPAEENVQLARNSVAIAQRQVEHDRVIAEGALHPTGSSLTQFYIRSPIDGIVTAVNMSSGLAVSPGTVLASVVDTHQLYVDANAYQSDLRGIEARAPIEVVADGFPGKPFQGRVSSIGQVVDPNTRTVAVRSLIENRHDELRPGLWVQVTISPPSPRQALLVPSRAVLVDGQDHYVIVATADGKYQKRKITPGVTADGNTEVVDGLKAGEKVITEGNLLVVTE